MRRQPQLSLSLGFLFPETEGGLQGYITGHDTEFSKSKTRTERGRDAEAELHNANPHQEQDATLVASDCTSGLGSGERVLKILQVILISSENHFSK